MRRVHTGSRPSPPIDASKRATPRSSAVSTLASAVPRVSWKCRPTRSALDPGAVERVEQFVDAARRRHAGRVAEREPVGARVDQVARELRDPLGRDVAFVRTAERGRDDRLGLDAGAVRELDDIARTHERLGDRAAHVLPVVRLARAHDQLELVGLGVDGMLGALGVRHERRVDDAGPAIDRSHDLLGAGHRRDRRRRDERGRLDATEPGRRQRVDQANALGNGDRCFVLQAVTRSDLADLDACGPVGHPVRLGGWQTPTGLASHPYANLCS